SLEDAMRRRRMDSPLLTDEYLDTRLQALEKRYKDKPDVLAQIRADDRLVRKWHAQNVTASYPESVLMSPPEPLAAHQRRVAAIGSPDAAGQQYEKTGGVLPEIAVRGGEGAAGKCR
ncbi:hypothetical protein, partial [Klebsiella michiganensis]